jgi:outer membrane biosynthesis protein TonB
MARYDRYRIFWVFGIATAVMLGGLAAFAQEKQPPANEKASISIVGKKGEAKVIEKNGTVEEASKQDLLFLNRSKASSRPAKAEPKPEKTAEEQAKAGEKKDSDQQKPAAEGTKPDDQKKPAQPPGARDKAVKKEVKKEVDEQVVEAKRKVDTEVLRQLRRQGAWFYDKDGKPISGEDLDKRVESGDVGGIKATDIYMRQWSAESEAKEEKPNQ